MVALVGESGGGKSTVAALLERFYDVGGGGVFVDGVDVRRLDPKWLRGRALGYINQEPVLFAASVRENIRYGRPDATDQEVTHLKNIILFFVAVHATATYCMFDTHTITGYFPFSRSTKRPSPPTPTASSPPSPRDTTPSWASAA